MIVINIAMTASENASRRVEFMESNYKGAMGEMGNAEAGKEMRNAEGGRRVTDGMRNAECGMRNS
jgi:hypothetical protein